MAVTKSRSWVMSGVLIAAVSMGGALELRAQEPVARLPPEQFDVIAPSDRVRGAPGEMSVTQHQCRVGPTHWARRRIVDIAVQEWAVFGFQTIDAANIEDRLLPPGLVSDTVNPALAAPRIARRYPRLGISESSEDVAATIAGYWSATPDAVRILNGQNRAWNGPGGDAVNWLQPWSAAFISWIMCEAGLGDANQFERDVSHRVYVDQAIRARDGGAPQAAFVAYDAGEVRIEPGDLLCNARGQAPYRNLADRRQEQGRFAPTHCDVVVKVDFIGQRILVIGGNVEQSVSLTILPAVQEDGQHLRPVDEAMIDGARTVFAHLKLRADPVEANALDNSPTIQALANAPPLGSAGNLP